MNLFDHGVYNDKLEPFSGYLFVCGGGRVGGDEMNVTET